MSGVGQMLFPLSAENRLDDLLHATREAAWQRAALEELLTGEQCGQLEYLLGIYRALVAAAVTPGTTQEQYDNLAQQAARVAEDMRRVLCGNEEPSAPRGRG